MGNPDEEGAEGAGAGSPYKSEQSYHKTAGFTRVLRARRLDPAGLHELDLRPAVRPFFIIEDGY
jgi:hypothetical protein